MQPQRRPKSQARTAIAVQDRPVDLEDFLPFELIAAATRIAAALNATCLAPHGLTPGEWRVLTLAGLHDGISATEISRRAVLDKVKVSRAVAALAARGLLRQVANAEDARARRLELTKRGRTLLARLTPGIRAFDATLAEGLTAAQRAALRGLLAKLLAA